MTDQSSPLGNPEHPLELSAHTMRAMIEHAMARIVPHIESLPEQPASDTTGGEALALSLRESIPREGQAFEALFDEIFRVAHTSLTANGPGYLAYIPGGGLFHTAVADLIADSINRYVGVWAAAPGLAQLEANVVRWFCDMVGYPESAGGFLTSGGSFANLSAVVTARRKHLPDDFLRGTIYTSDQVHHSVHKAALLAGFPTANVRCVPTDGEFRIRIDALADRIASDRQEGYQPFLIIGSAGTTNTGAVDDLSGLADLAEQENMWFHVDAAYGGFFVLTERGRQGLAGLERADSMSLDPHKGLFVPYGTGSLLVKDRQALVQAHSVSADYMPSIQENADLVDFCEISPELSRPFRGLGVWLPIKMHGVDVFARTLDEKLDLSQWITGKLEQVEGLEILARPQLTVTAFGVMRPGWSFEEANRATRSLLDAVNRRRRVYLTGTMLEDRFVIRICVLSFRTHKDRMVMCYEDVVAGLDEVAL